MVAAPLCRVPVKPLSVHGRGLATYWQETLIHRGGSPLVGRQMGRLGEGEGRTNQILKPSHTATYPSAMTPRDLVIPQL